MLDWYDEFGIRVYKSNALYSDIITYNKRLNNDDSVATWKNDINGVTRFEHTEYAFKFSEHELHGIDLKDFLTKLEKVFVLEQWKYIYPIQELNPARFYGKLGRLDIKETMNNLLYVFECLNDQINMLVKLKETRDKERPVFFSRIPWELLIRNKPIWYPDGYKEKYDFEKMKNRKPTEDEIVNNASLYTRFSTGFV